MASLLYRLGRLSAHRAWQFIVAWVVLLGLSVGSFLLFGGTLISQVTIPGTATETVQKQLTEDFALGSGGSGAVVFATTNGKPFTQAQKSGIASSLARAEDVAGVNGYVDPFETTAQLEEQQRQLTDGKDQIVNAQNS